nr:hypothetical protein [Candidatus Kuenenia stuttgartiensis]
MVLLVLMVQERQLLCDFYIYHGTNFRRCMDCRETYSIKDAELIKEEIG